MKTEKNELIQRCRKEIGPERKKTAFIQPYSESSMSAIKNCNRCYYMQIRLRLE